jgi:hypothetical protein
MAKSVHRVRTPGCLPFKMNNLSRLRLPDCTKENPLPKGVGGRGSSWDRFPRQHPDAIVIDRSDQYTNIFLCPHCNETFSLNSDYFMDCVAQEYEDGQTY